ncbi:hypothetical protein [Streptomyces sp. H39-S7]|uniref:hypothetical protein n=1 Tax=Streptomyces sp. H39-S7 TaxID=3004357 RepID=UPI0022AF3E76|nr:hypothetical protein [Streptomyces sp. H39-S7]MCZ4125387.1 hypothetical protein [Streptomyces sp. H39-S7]
MAYIPSSGEPTVNGERTELSKPIRRVPAVPDPKLHREIRAGLKKRGMADHVAGAISTIWTDPAAVLPQIANPQRRRIPGAYLLVISGTVYTSRLVPDPLNPRNADHVPFALAQDQGAPPATMVPAVQVGEGELAIRVASREALAEQVDWAMETTRDRNRPVPDIAEQGIMDPPIGVATTVSYDGTDESATTHIVVREGSSRVSHGLFHVGTSAEDILFSLPRSASAMQAHIDAINSSIAKPDPDILDNERAAIRCAVVDFELIIGVVPDVDGAVDLSQAIKARVAQDHLNTKEQWSDAAKNTALSEECLISARAAGAISSNSQADWLAGRLTPKEAAAHKLVPYGDDRAARAIHLFTTSDPKIHNAVRRPIALVLTNEPTGRRKRALVNTKTKLPLAVELIVREKRGRASESEITRYRKTLTDALPQDLHKAVWHPTELSPEELFQAAQKEQEAEADDCPATKELWVRGAYVLAKHGAISGPRHDEGPGGDRRSASVVMAALVESDRGLRHLRQAIEDDRAGVTPRQVDDQGQPRKDGEGKDMPLTSDFIRVALVPKEGTPLPPLDPTAAVREHYKRGVQSTKNALRALETEMRNLGALKDADDIPLIERDGRVPARLLMDKLNELADEAKEWWEKAVESQGNGPASPPASSNDADGEAAA